MATSSQIEAFVLPRVRDLLIQHWSGIEAAWKSAWIAYQQDRGKPRWYINTESIPNAALTDSLSALLKSLRVTAQEGQPLRIYGFIPLNDQAVLSYHNAHRTHMSTTQEIAVRFQGANPLALGITGSFQAIKRPFLSAFLMAGPNTSAGSASYVKSKRPTTVFTQLGNSVGGAPLVTQRAGVGNTGDRLMRHFAVALGFSSITPAQGGPLWSTTSTLASLRPSTVFGAVMTVVMAEVKTKFPEVQFE